MGEGKAGLYGVLEAILSLSTDDSALLVASVCCLAVFLTCLGWLSQTCTSSVSLRRPIHPSVSPVAKNIWVVEHSGSPESPY